MRQASQNYWVFIGSGIATALLILGLVLVFTLSDSDSENKPSSQERFVPQDLSLEDVKEQRAEDVRQRQRQVASDERVGQTLYDISAVLQEQGPGDYSASERVAYLESQLPKVRFSEEATKRPEVYQVSVDEDNTTEVTVFDLTGQRSYLTMNLAEGILQFSSDED